MIFSGLVFITAFLPLTLLVYIAVPERNTKIKNAVLLIASLVFYGWGEPKYILVLLASIVLNYFLTMAIYQKKENDDPEGARRLFILDVVLEIGILVFFKYANFVINTVNDLTDSGPGILSIALPIGISFYTLQIMSYVIDVYRGDIKAERDFLSFACYISMFPKLIAGPIVRYSDIEKRLKKRENDGVRFTEGIRRFVFGLSKKVLIANQMGIIWNEIYGMAENGQEPGALTVWIGALAFTFRIYFDFSGYSDMAIGLGKLLGFDLPENFDFPYIAGSVTEFWKRWHISLTSWFRDYVYIPLGGNRKGLKRQIINILIVWVLAGLWHGAGWNFLIWGLYYALILIIEKLFLNDILLKISGKLSFVKHVYTLFIVIIGWVIFSITDLGMMGEYLGLMFGKGQGTMDQAMYYLTSRAGLFVIAALVSTPLVRKYADKLISNIRFHTSKDMLETFITVILFIMCIAFIVSGSNDTFLYFRF